MKLEVLTVVKMSALLVCWIVTPYGLVVIKPKHYK
jgi:hypothetical protein